MYETLNSHRINIDRILLSLLFRDTSFFLFPKYPFRRGITGVGLDVTHAGIIRGFCLQRFCVDGVLMIEKQRKS